MKKIHVGFLHSLSSDIHYIMTPTMYFVELSLLIIAFITYLKITVDSLKFSVVTFKIHAFVACLTQTVYLLCWHYMLDAFTILLCSKLC